MIILLGMRESWLLNTFSFVFSLYDVCPGLFALPLGVIGGLYSVTVALPRYLLYYYYSLISTNGYKKLFSDS